MKFQHVVLDNGLEIISEFNEFTYSVSLGFFVRTGSRDETDELSGVSHFLEHMIFKGTPTRSAEDVNRELDEMGGLSNAYTSSERTAFYLTVLPDQQTRGVELLADLMRPSLRKEDFETEKKVILEEINMYKDAPPFGADDICQKEYFGTHPLSRSVLGTADSVQALTDDQMCSYFEERYVPENIIVAASGRVDFDELVQSVKKCCGHWKAVSSPRTYAPCSGNQGVKLLVQAGAAQEYIMRISPGMTISDPNCYSASLLTSLLGDDVGGRYFWEFLDSGLADYASVSDDESVDTGVFQSVFSCSPENVSELLQRLLALYGKISQEGFTAQELARAKTKILTRIVMSTEHPLGRLFVVAGNWMDLHRYFSLQEISESYQAVTLDSIHRVWENYPFTSAFTMLIGPMETLPAGIILD